jgi:mRNA deadenylase 3'-5' endonuclease subunit Ccr4
VVYGSDKKELYSMNFDGVHDYVFEVDIDIESKTTLDKVVFEYTKETIKVPSSKCPIL